MARSSTEAIPPELKLGLRNYWYPIVDSAQVPANKPLGVKRLGESLVVWRDGDGAPHVFPDRCAHRAAPLSVGDLVNGRIQCRYHGLQYDGTGQCRLVPLDLEEDGRQARSIRIHPYTVDERGGMVWAYLGDEELFPPPPLWTDPALDDPDMVGIVKETTWEANWLLVHDNTIDPAHLPFLHGHFAAEIMEGELSFRPLGYGNPVVTPAISLDTVRDKLTAKRTRDGGVRLSRSQASDDHSQTFDEVVFDLPACSKVWVPAPDGGHPIRSIQYEYPIDEDQTIVYAWIGRRVDSEADRGPTIELLENFIWPAFRQVFMEDSWITKVQGDLEETRRHEHLLSSDVGSAALRRALLEVYEQQQERIAEYRASHPGDGAASSQNGGPRGTQARVAEGAGR